MSTLCLLKVGEPGPELKARYGGYENWFARSLAPLGCRPLTHDLREQPNGGLPPADGYLIMGAPEAVFDPLPWLPAVRELVAGLIARERPLLGVCFGHQLMTQACGGQVAENPNGWEIGTVEVELTDAGRNDPLFEGLPARLTVQATHRDAVVRPPAGATLLARSSIDRFSAFRLGRRAWTVQFHPEITAPLMADVIESRRELLLAAGGCPDTLVAGVCPTPTGRRLLANFLKLLTPADGMGTAVMPRAGPP